VFAVFLAADFRSSPCAFGFRFETSPYTWNSSQINNAGVPKIYNADKRLTKTLRLGLRSSPVAALDVDAFFPRDRKCRVGPIIVTPSLIRSEDTLIKDELQDEGVLREGDVQSRNSMNRLARLHSQNTQTISNCSYQTIEVFNGRSFGEPTPVPGKRQDISFQGENKGHTYKQRTSANSVGRSVEVQGYDGHSMTKCPRNQP
jgi:hypothetical protein